MRPSSRHLIGLLAICACADTTPANAQRIPQAELRAALEAWAAPPEHHGVTAAVVLRDGTLWTGVAGDAVPGRPITERDLINIASITKSMTGALILQLVDEKRLRLEDSIGKWLPPYHNVSPAITIRQLLNHTSGVANYATNPSYSAAVTGRTTRMPADSVLMFVDAPLFAPGTRTQYGNSAFVLLSLIAERATGQPLGKLMRERVWDRAKITDIFLPLSEKPRGTLAPVMVRNAPGDPNNGLAMFASNYGAAGAMATAASVAKWGHALFTGRIISDSLQRAMRTLVPAAGNIPGESGAGLGIRAYNYLGRTQYGHSGGSGYGTSLMVHDPQSGVTIAVIMSQGVDANPFELVPTLLRIVAGS